MDVQFKDKGLEDLYYSPNSKEGRKYPRPVVDAFFDVVGQIEAATSVQDLRNLQNLRYHQLQGKRAGQCAMKLTGRYRLIVVEVSTTPGLIVIEIVDYH